MHNLSNKTLAFFIALLFFTSVSAEEILHEHHDHHDHHDHMSVEIDCDFCVNAAPEFDNEVFNFGDQFLNISEFIQTLDNQFLDNNTSEFYSRGPPQI